MPKILLALVKLMALLYFIKEIESAGLFSPKMLRYKMGIMND